MLSHKIRTPSKVNVITGCWYLQIYFSLLPVLVPSSFQTKFLCSQSLSYPVERQAVREETKQEGQPDNSKGEWSCNFKYGGLESAHGKGNI